MTFLLFLFYAALGGAAGWTAHMVARLEMAIAIAIGAAVFALLGQLHILVTRKGSEKQLAKRLGTVETLQRDTSERMDVIEARTGAVESTLKHELTERRDALVAEMKQLEALIERLSRSFEARLSEQPRSYVVPDADDLALRAVKDALDAGRLDLYLQPIVSLPQRRVAFYEGFTRLRRENGAIIRPAEFLEPARRARLMGMIDILSLFRCVQIVRHLAARDRRVGVFCNVSTAALADPKYFQSFLDFMAENRDLSGSLIFEIEADRFETRSRDMRANMDKLVAMGFRFSVDHTPNLALDLPRLQDAGVKFAKFHGQTLVDHLRDPAGSRPVSSINRQLSGEDVSAVFARHGVTMIAEKLEDEASVLEVLEFDIPYGQGNVFGPARPIKSSLMQETAPPQDFVKRIGSFG